MPGPFEPDESGFESFLRYLGRPGYAVRDLLTGNVEGALRQGADLLGDTVDAFLPGDWIPEASRRGTEGEPNDYTEGSDLLREWGVADLEPGLGKLAADIGVGLVTDPLTYLGVGAAANAAKGASAAKTALTVGVPFSKTLRTAIPGSEKLVEGVKGAAGAAYQALPDVVRTGLESAAGAAGRGLRKLGIGDPRVASWARPILDEASAAGAGTRQAQQAALKAAMEGLSPEEADALFAAVHGVAREGGLGKAGGRARVLAPNGAARLPTGDIDPLTGAKQSGVKAPIEARDPRVYGPQLSPLDEMLGMQGVDVTSNLPPGVRVPDDVTAFRNFDEQVDVIGRNLDALGVDPARKATLMDAAKRWVEFSGKQFKSAVDEQVLATPQGRDLLRESPMYAPRGFIPDEAQMPAARGAASKATEARSLRTPEQLADYLNNNPKATLEDALQMGSARANEQGQMVARARLARGLVEKYSRQAEEKLVKAAQSTEGWETMPEAARHQVAGLTNAEREALGKAWAPLASPQGKGDLAKAAEEILKEVRQVDPETADALELVYRGMAPRGTLMNVIAGGNKMFKRFATAGAFIPRISFGVRNVTTGGAFQVLANPEARAVWPQYAKQAAKTIVRATDDGLERLTGKRPFRSEDEFAQFEEALRASGGDFNAAVNAIQDPVIRDAFRTGVVGDGFIASEQLADDIARRGWKKTYADIRDWPAEIAGGTEKRMRLSVFRALVEDRGMSAEEAARVVSETFFNYTPNSVWNRTARDVIPFFQFTAKAIPQALKFMREQPAVAGAVRPFYTQDSAEDPLPPYAQRQMAVPLGEDEAGNAQYLTGLGLPIEALNSIPNPSDDLMDFLAQARQGVVGQSSPLLKTAVGAASGVDPYFGSPFMSYDKAPEVLQALGADERGEIGRLYNALAGTGAIQPLASPVQYLSGMMDDRKSGTEALIGATTGAKLLSVDEDQALRQIVEQYLARNPGVKRHTSFYQTSDDPETQAALAALRDLRARIREKREAAAP